MSTRAVVAVPDPAGWRGRYVHWGADLRPALVTILRRDGYAAAVNTLTATFGWSEVTGDPAAALDPDRHEPDRFQAVPGYGIAYTPAEYGDEWVTPDNAGEYWVEVVYVLTPDGVAVHTIPD